MYQVLLIVLTLSIKSNCFTLDRDALEVQPDAVHGRNHNLRVIRQMIGYPSPVQPRDQTVIVVPNTGTNTNYRGQPMTYGGSRSPTVIVNVPDDKYYPTIGRRYVGNPKKI